MYLLVFIASYLWGRVLGDIVILHEEEPNSWITHSTVCTGSTGRTTTNWVDYNAGVFVDVDISECGFLTLPTITTSLDVYSANWETRGTSSVWSATNTKFSIFIQSSVRNAVAKSDPWSVWWIAVGVTSSNQSDNLIVNGEKSLSPRESFRVCSGTTGRTTTDWVDMHGGGVDIWVDISKCGFLTVPTLMTSVEGSANNWIPKGQSVIRGATAETFRHLVGYGSWISPEAVKNWLWNIDWIAVGLTSENNTDIVILNGEEPSSTSNNSIVCSGSTGRTTTNWLNYESDGIYADVNISGCGFLTVPTVTTSLEGSGDLSKVTGTSSVLFATNTQFRVYIGTYTWIRSDYAKSQFWNINWLAVGFTTETTRLPTESPTIPCVDKYDYCSSVPLVQGCNNENYETRLHFQNDCPVSCNTCDSEMISPTYFPTPAPTLSPTSIIPTSNPSTPTCVDRVEYCNLILESCRSNHSVTSVKMLSHCPLSCGFCSQEPTRTPFSEPTRTPLSEPTRTPTYRPSKLPTTSPIQQKLAESGGAVIPTIYIIGILILGFFIMICILFYIYMRWKNKNLVALNEMMNLSVVDPKPVGAEMLDYYNSSQYEHEGMEGALPTPVGGATNF